MREKYQLHLLHSEGLVPITRKLAVVKLEPVSHPETLGLKIESLNPFVKAVDVRCLLERENPMWKDELAELAKQAPERVIIGGSVATSLEASDFRTYYQPTNGMVIKRSLPWLLKLFRRDFRYLVEQATGDPSVHLGEDLEHSLNMNYTQEGGYELHTDRNPVTALLGAETIEENEGGKLVVYEKYDPVTHRPTGRRYAIRPTAGVLYIFNGRRHPHRVTQLQRRMPRLVAPGDYYSSGVPETVDENFNRIIGVADAA